MNFYVLNGKHAYEVSADDAEAAALDASRWCSVYEAVRGLELQVFPVEFVQTVKVQYEHPNAAGRDERLVDYGRTIVVDEFVDTPYARDRGPVLTSFAKEER